MKNRIWNNIANIKFKSIYTGKVSKRSYHTGNIYSFFLALASATSVAAWTVWETLPMIWASIVAISQLFHIAKPFIPFIKNDRDFIEMSLQYESLYLSYERLWYDHRKNTDNEEEIETRFFNLREKEHEINKKFKHIVCPDLKGLGKQSDEETNKFLETNF